MFDTHCHLQFETFDGKVDKIIVRARASGVIQMVIPSTDLETSKKAVAIAENYDGVYAAVGIHPHHIFKFQITPLRSSSYEGQANSKKQTNSKLQMNNELEEIERLVKHEKVVAVGEIGVDRHYYSQTRYSDYQIDNEFIILQKEILRYQMAWAVKYNKSLILHNREAKKDLLTLLKLFKELKELAGRAVFHCCEPEMELLEFASKYGFFIGVDGDVTYNKRKAEFIKRVPLERLVVETDSPFLIPEPLRSKRVFPNEPKNLTILVTFLAKLLHVSDEEIVNQTTTNAHRLFSLKS